jgi:arylsulfatase
MKTQDAKRALSAGQKLLLATTAGVFAPAGRAPSARAQSPAAAAKPGPSTFPGRRQAPEGAPNALVIMTDDVGFGASSTFGGPIPTPTFDKLAANGLRYNAFHTTALCSPTRAALLTGRNHHSVGAGIITDLATADDGYTSVLPKNAATIGEVLRENGYSTSWFGKNHNTPEWETGPNGPFDRWPTGLGFEYFYGFHGGETNQWAPALIENTRTVEPPTDDPKYILDKDLADHAINWLHVQHATDPNKPFLMYIAPGTAHAPHHAPKEWIEKFKGKFDQGWDTMREETFARQKAQGIISADAELTPRPPSLPAWDPLSPEQKHLYAHMMEVYAAALAYCDDQIGRVIEELRLSGQLDNTIVIYIQGDNGASAEGGFEGAVNMVERQQGVVETLTLMLSRYDQLGGPQAYNHYPAGWAWAMNTPFQWTKQVASHFGGTRNGMVLSWPGHIAQPGGVRPQFSHVVDIAPTLYEAIGITPPEVVDGVAQQPLVGASLPYTLNQPAAPTRHTSQYFEMFANRAMVDDGWMASTTPKRLPWQFPMETIDPDSFQWELYHIDQDYSQAHDLAAQDPERLKKLQAEFEKVAVKEHVLPLMASTVSRILSKDRPYSLEHVNEVTVFPSPARYPHRAFPDILNRSWTISAKLEAPAHDAHGVIVTQGGRFGGWAMMVRDSGKPAFIYRRSTQPGDLTVVEGRQPLAPGPHEVTADFTYDGGGLGKGGVLVLKVDGVEVSRARLEQTLVTMIGFDGAAVGHDTETPILEDYQVPYAFTGKIERVDFKLR